MLQEEDIILMIYCAISDELGSEDYKHPQAHLYLSEIMLCGILFALKGGSFDRFYTWLKRRKLFILPDNTRLNKLLKTHSKRCRKFFAQESFFNVIDSYGIELIKPIREGRSNQSKALCGKGKSNHRWIVGRKICVLINERMEVVDIMENTANTCDKHFNKMAMSDSSITLADKGFRDKHGIPENMKICERGKWNERMGIETVFSLWTRVCNLKNMFVRSVKAFKSRITYLAAFHNIALKLNKSLGVNNLSLAHFAL
jgi:hypothetical protein